MEQIHHIIVDSGEHCLSHIITWAMSDKEITSTACYMKLVELIRAQK